MPDTDVRSERLDRTRTALRTYLQARQDLTEAIANVAAFDDGREDDPAPYSDAERAAISDLTQRQFGRLEDLRLACIALKHLVLGWHNCDSDADERVCSIRVDDFLVAVVSEDASPDELYYDLAVIDLEEVLDLNETGGAR